MKRRLHFFWQRLTRGWDDSETWALDETIARFALPRLRRFRQLNCGHPSNLSGLDEWNGILDEIEWYLGQVAACEFDAAPEHVNRMIAARKLWGEYFEDLWWRRNAPSPAPPNAPCISPQSRLATCVLSASSVSTAQSSALWPIMASCCRRWWMSCRSRQPKNSPACTCLALHSANRCAGFVVSRVRLVFCLSLLRCQKKSVPRC